MASSAPVDTSARASLAQRVLPQMTLADGSMKPEGPETAYDPRTAAERRFRVSGAAIITGGSGSLGLAVARALLEHSCTGVMIWDLASTLQSPAASSAISRLQTDFPGQPVATADVDCTDAGAVSAAMQSTAAFFGGHSTAPRHVLCLAGIVNCTPAVDEDPARFRKVLDINATGSFLVAQAFARHLAPTAAAGQQFESEASVVLTASLGAGQVLFPQPQVAYNSSKAAVVSITKNLAAEWASRGIRVNCICPGYMDTVLNEGPGLEDARREWMSRCPMGRMGRPDEMGGACVMLCSSAGRYITGAEIAVDGGSSVF